MDKMHTSMIILKSSYFFRIDKHRRVWCVSLSLIFRCVFSISILWVVRSFVCSFVRFFFLVFLLFFSFSMILVLPRCVECHSRPRFHHDVDKSGNMMKHKLLFHISSLFHFKSKSQTTWHNELFMNVNETNRKWITEKKSSRRTSTIELDNVLSKTQTKKKQWAKNERWTQVKWNKNHHPISSSSLIWKERKREKNGGNEHFVGMHDNRTNEMPNKWNQKHKNYRMLCEKSTLSVNVSQRKNKETI